MEQHENWHDREIEGVFYITIGIVVLLTNVLIFIVIACDSNLRTKTNFLLVNLAVSGCLIVLFGIPVQIVNMYKKNDPISSTNNIICNIQGLSILVPFLASIFILVLIAVHRYILVVKNIIYQKFFTWRKLILVSVLIWLLAIVICLPPFFGWGSYSYHHYRGHCNIVWSHSTGYVTFVHMFTFPVPLFVMIFCYQQVISYTRASMRRISEHSCGRLSKTNKSGGLRLTIMLVLVVFCFFISFLPYCVVMVMEGYIHKHSPKTLSFAALLFAYTNSVFNFWIYAFMDMNFRKALIKLVKRRLPMTSVLKNEECLRIIKRNSNSVGDGTETT